MKITQAEYVADARGAMQRARDAKEQLAITDTLGNVRMIVHCYTPPVVPCTCSPEERMWTCLFCDGEPSN